jgi:CRISPR system Cascade subunit CasE
MIASVYRLSRSDIAKLKVTDDYSLHRIVYSLFPEECGGDAHRDFLYADKGGDFRERTILILSRRPPREPEAGSIESREVPSSFLSYDRYAFEVVMNPTRRDARTTKTVAVRGMDELKAWFMGRAAGWGFALDEDRLSISRLSIQQFEHKGDGSVVHSSACYSGILEVCDRELFAESFEKGIGRCRGFGFGLLQIRPVTD